MKLRLVTDHHLNSGIGRYSFELSQALLDLGHDVTLSKLYKSDGDDLHFDEQYDWISKIRYKSLKDLHPYLLPYFIGAHIFNAKADLFHAHWFMAGLGLLKNGKRNSVITMHDVSLLHEKEKEGKFLSFYRNAIDQFTKKNIPIIVVSESAKEDALKYSSLKPEQVHAVHNGVNFEQFFPKEKKVNDRFQIVYAGGLSPRKNVELLIDACEILEARNIEYLLKIAGNHPDRTPYPGLVADKKLKNVFFEGFIADDDMNDFYNQADLFVYPSKYEGFGFAPLEAMAAGTPVISTRGGSLHEVSGGGAQLVDYYREELAETIIAMIENEEKRNQLAKKGLEWVERYTWENCAMQTLDVYKTIQE